MIPTDTHRQQLQRSYSYRFCARCQQDQPSKGGTVRAGLFSCARHGKEAKQ